MKLGTKIFLGFSAILVIMIALGVIIMIQMRAVEKESEILAVEYVPEFAKVSTLNQNVLLMRMSILKATYTRTEEDVKKGQAAYETVNSNLKDFKSFVDSSAVLTAGKQEAVTLTNQLTEYNARSEEMYTMLLTMNEQFGELVKYGGEFVSKGEAVNALQKASLEKMNKPEDYVDRKELQDRVFVTFRILNTGLMIRLKTASAMYLDNIDALQGVVDTLFPELGTLLSELEKLHPTGAEHEGVMDMIALSNKYKATVEAYLVQWNKLIDSRTSAGKIGIEFVNRSNNLGETAKNHSLNIADKTRENLNSAIYVLTFGIIIAVALGVILAIVITRGITGPINAIISSLDEAGSQVAAASNQISSASQSLAEGATEQAASLEESSSALEEMASMTRQNADNASNANQMMVQTQEQVTNGAGAVGNMSTAMSEINDSSEQTSRIIGTIEEIAFQTNLLALNAAVEAARAGDAGKGFAVVADEVRNLAQRSAQAARDTAELIESTVARVKNGSSIVQELQTSFGEVEGSVKHFGGLINEISAASNEQAQGVDQVNTAVAQMDKVTQTNAANAEESASAAEELSAQASQLSSLVSELNIIVTGESSTHTNVPASPVRKLAAPRMSSVKKEAPSSSTMNHKALAKSDSSSNLVRPHEVIPLDDDDDFEDF